MKWYRIGLTRDVVRSLDVLMKISSRDYQDLEYGVGKGYHLYIRDDCNFFADRALTCPVKSTEITLDELNILLLNKSLKD